MESDASANGSVSHCWMLIASVKRQDGVAYLSHIPCYVRELQAAIKPLSDLERLTKSHSIGHAQPRRPGGNAGNFIEAAGSRKSDKKERKKMSRVFLNLLSCPPSRTVQMN